MLKELTKLLIILSDQDLEHTGLLLYKMNCTKQHYYSTKAALDHLIFASGTSTIGELGSETRDKGSALIPGLVVFNCRSWD